MAAILVGFFFAAQRYEDDDNQLFCSLAYAHFSFGGFFVHSHTLEQVGAALALSLLYIGGTSVFCVADFFDRPTETGLFLAGSFVLIRRFVWLDVSRAYFWKFQKLNLINFTTFLMACFSRYG